MNMTGAVLACALAVAVAAPVLNAGAPVPAVLPYGDQAFKPGEKLQLKRRLKSLDAGFDFANKQLVRVRVLAKSQQGRGRLRLVVGSKHTPWQTVGGTAEGWDNAGGASFRELVLDNPAGGSEGYWRIEIDGHIKVREVTLEVREELGKAV